MSQQPQHVDKLAAHPGRNTGQVPQAAVEGVGDFVGGKVNSPMLTQLGRTLQLCNKGASVIADILDHCKTAAC